MTAQVTHVTIKEKPFQPRPVMTVGRIINIVPQAEPETVFSTVRREEDAEDKAAHEAEAKVVRPRRGRRVKTSEDAETK